MKITDLVGYGILDRLGGKFHHKLEGLKRASSGMFWYIQVVLWK